MTEGQFINLVREFLGLEPLYHEKRSERVVSVDTKRRLTPQRARERVLKVRQKVEEFDHEVAFSEEVRLMREYILQRANAGDKTATEITKSWAIEFNRHCA